MLTVQSTQPCMNAEIVENLLCSPDNHAIQNYNAAIIHLNQSRIHYIIPPNPSSLPYLSSSYSDWRTHLPTQPKSCRIHLHAQMIPMNQPLPKLLNSNLWSRTSLTHLLGGSQMKMKAALSAGVPQRHYVPRQSIRRDHEGAHERLKEDYFASEPLYPESMFHTRFRMNRHLFLCIVDALGQWSPCFIYRADCASRIGLSPLQKCTAAMRMLAYGTPADALDEYLKIGKCTTLQCLDNLHDG